MQKRAFIYIRVSTKEQAEEGYSLGEQEERLKKYCDAMDWSVVNVYRDGGYSGATIERPAMQDMIKEIERGHADIVLVDKLDRLSRSQFDTLYLIQKVFTPNNCAFVSRAEAFDTSSAFGRAMVGILSVFAELERERIKERMKDGKDGRAKEGLYKGGGYVPIGYTYNEETGILDVNPYEAMLVQKVYELYLARSSTRNIMEYMNSRGLCHHYGKWNKTTVEGVLQNRTYLGEHKLNNVWIKAKHKAIIDTATFELAQDIKLQRSEASEKRRQGRHYTSPLGGLVFCAHCGAKYGYRINGRNADGSPRAYYMCYSRQKSDKKLVKDPNCKNKNYRDRDLEALIYEQIESLNNNIVYFDQIVASKDKDVNIQQCEKRITELSRQISRLMELYSVASIDIDELKEKIEPLSNEKASLQSTIDTLKNSKAKRSKAEVQSIASSFKEALVEQNSELLHSLIGTLIDYIEIDGEDVAIHWNF